MEPASEARSAPLGPVFLPAVLESGGAFSRIHSLIRSFIQQVFIECPPCAIRMARSQRGRMALSQPHAPLCVRVRGGRGPEEAAGAGTTQGLTGGPGPSPGPGAAAQPPFPEPQLWSRAGQGQEASAERAAACRQTQPLSSGCSPKSRNKLGRIKIRPSSSGEITHFKYLQPLELKFSEMRT